MKNLCYAVCVCLTAISTAHAGEQIELQDANIVQAFDRVEARLASSFSDMGTASGDVVSRAAPGKEPIIKRSSKKDVKTVRIMSHNVNVKAFKVIANAVMKHKLKLKLKF